MAKEFTLRADKALRNSINTWRKFTTKQVVLAATDTLEEIDVPGNAAEVVIWSKQDFTFAESETGEGCEIDRIELGILDMGSIMSLRLKRALTGGSRSAIDDAYGVAYDTVAKTFTRLGTLSEYSATYSNKPFSNIPELLLPIQRNMKRCVVNDDLSINYFLDPNDSTKKANGEAADLSGADGQVMVNVPEHWHKFEKIGDVMYWWIAPTVKTGTGWVYFPGGYFSAYEGQKYDAATSTIIGGAATGTWDAANDKLCSVSGVLPYTDEKRSEYRAIAANRGTGWHQQDNKIYAAVARLFIIEYASFDTQGKISDGVANADSADWSAYNGYSPLHVAGLTNSLGNNSGEVSLVIPAFVGGTADLNTQVMSYRGIENWYGHIWKWLDGINIFHDGTGDGESKLYLCSDPANYADDTAINYELAGYLPKASGYYGFFLAIADGFFPDSADTGSSSVGITDYYYSGYDAEAANWRVAALGGAANGGVRAGAFGVNSYSSSASDLSHFGGRLCAILAAE
jgi:hypothetical protein